MRVKNLTILTVFLGVLLTASFIRAESHILTPEESLWLKSRNNTIVVYPEKNFPPFSYTNASGTPNGISIDYIKLIAKKINAKVEFLPARSRSQILDDIKTNKGDVITSLTDTKDREEYLYFSDEYISSPAVIVTRKDYNRKVKNLTDFNGKRVAVGDSYAVEEHIRTNFPSVVIESVTDDEFGLQQLVLGEVDAAIMDIASLSYFISKQVLSSVKIVGNVGFEYKLAFAVPKDKEILQSIIDKGLSQISQSERDVLNEKWISPSLKSENNLSSFDSETTPYFLATTIALFGFAFVINRKYSKSRHSHLSLGVNELKEELAELAHANRILKKDMEEVKELEEDIEKKIEKLD